MTSQTILFLGFGLADEDFRRLYHEVVRHLGNHKRRAYAVQLNPTLLTEKYWQQKNVQIIAADATEFLEALGKQVGVQVGTTKATPSLPGGKQQASQSTLRPSSVSKGDPSLKHGMDALKAVFKQGDNSDAYLAFTTLESRLLSNLKDERIFGTTEEVRSERARIVLELNRLALDHAGCSFNELCEA
jgi:hypothetical protein